MLVKCSKCGKTFDDEKYYGICPKCGRYNRKEDDAEKEHQALHDKYDGGYAHTEEDDHHRFHEEHDSTYRHTDAPRSDGTIGNRASQNGNGTNPRVNIPDVAPGKPTVGEGNRETGQKPHMNKVLKIILIIILLQFGLRFLFYIIAFLTMLPF